MKGPPPLRDASLALLVVLGFLISPAARGEARSSGTTTPSGAMAPLAHDTITPGTPTRTPEVQAVEAAGLAARLVAWGRQHRSPLALVSAAEILLEHPTKAYSGPKEPGDGGAPAPGRETPEEGPVDPEELLREAGRMAGGDPHLAEVMQEIRTRASASARGAAGGAVTDADALAPRERLTYRIAFSGGRPARLVVVGDGNGDLDCTVYRAGTRVVTDSRYVDGCDLAWLPDATGQYQIVVTNQGGDSTNYQLYTN
jgi:hypothetical protein